MHTYQDEGPATGAVRYGVSRSTKAGDDQMGRGPDTRVLGSPSAGLQRGNDDGIQCSRRSCSTGAGTQHVVLNGAAPGRASTRIQSPSVDSPKAHPDRKEWFK